MPPGYPPVTPGEFASTAGSSAASAVSAMSARTSPARLAVERAAQQLNADLKPPLAGPAPQRVERVLVIACAGEHLAEIGGEPAALGQRREKPFGQHRVEKRRPLRQLLGQARRPGHDLGDQRQQARDWHETARRAARRPGDATGTGRTAAAPYRDAGVAPKMRSSSGTSSVRISRARWLRVARSLP